MQPTGPPPLYLSWTSTYHVLVSPFFTNPAMPASNSSIGESKWGEP